MSLMEPGIAGSLFTLPGPKMDPQIVALPEEQHTLSISKTSTLCL
jgi:hypothetical protein